MTVFRAIPLGGGRVSGLLDDLIGVAKSHTEFILNVNEEIREKPQRVIVN